MERNICYNCFRERAEAAGPCPHCGYDPAADQGKYPFALPHGSVLAGQFITGRVLGQGGFGITYLAKDNKLDVKVAIKEFLPDSMAVRASGDHQVTVYTGQREENFRYGMDRFLDEARVLAKFQGNPNIVGVRSYFEENGTAYFVMDYIEGESFKAYIQNKGGKVSWQEAVRILTPVMDALGAVHKEGIIHRDVTPDNIVLTSDGGVKLLDFGSARYSLGDKSKSLDVVLKAGYAPKEQYIRRGKQGPYTDVYSLAACFYASITGYLPPEALERMDEDDLVPPSTRGIKLPSGFEDVILKGLEVQPGDRYQSMEEFRAAMDAALREKDASAQAAGPIPTSEEPVKPETGENTASADSSTSEPVQKGEQKVSLGERLKALPNSAKGVVAAAACLVIVLGVLAGSGVFSGGRPSAIDSGGGGGTMQADGDLHRTAQEGGIGQVDAPNGNTSEEETMPENETEGTDGEAIPAADTTVTDEEEKVAAEKATAEKAAAEKAATEKAAAEKAAAEKAAAEKAAAEKAAAEKAAAEKAAAEKAAAEKAAAEKAAAEKAAAEKAAAEKAAAEKAAAEKAAAEKAAAEKAAAEKAAAEKAEAERKAAEEAEKAANATTKVTNQRYTYSDPYMSGASGSYTGDWKDGKPNGQGTLIFDSEYSSMGYPSKYVGSWVNGNKHGYGVATWSNGNKYEGNFSNNKKSGWGKMTYSDGTVWEGNWSNDAPDK